MPDSPAKASHLQYQAQETSLTLREGLKEYADANPNLIDTATTSTESVGVYLNNHDVSHVVFGTTTELRDEAMQDMWTFLAIDIPAKQYVRNFLQEEEGKQVMTSLPVGGSIMAFFWMLGKLPQLMWRSWRMPKKWLWKGWESYLDVPLAEIRREFRIRVL